MRGRDERIDFTLDPEIVISAEKELEIMDETAKENHISLY